MAKKLGIDIWSDIACPWCYVGKRRFEAALALFPQRASVEVAWHAFELDPTAPPRRDDSVTYAGRLAAKYGMTVADAERKLAEMTETAAAEGLEFHFEKAQSGSTFDAHQVVHLGGVRGIQDKVKERLLRGYFSEGELVSDPETLVRLGSEAGLDAAEVKRVLEGDVYAADVRRDEATARELGISGVPFFVIGGRHGVSGAQPAQALKHALDRAWAETRDESPAATEGAACTPETCA